MALISDSFELPCMCMVVQMFHIHIHSLKNTKSKQKKMNVKRLRKNVISQIKSSYTITNPAQCVTELILNSLDANATSIAIRINFDTFQLQIIDNGDGINEENLQKIGLHHHTTKPDGKPNRNRRKSFGDSLANILTISESMEIVSRPKNEPTTLRKTLTGRGNTEVLVCDQNRPCFGTTLTIVGFFSKFPVRKQRLKANSELTELKTVLKRFAIINPNVSFTLRNNVNKKLEFSCEKRANIRKSLIHFYPELEGTVKLLKIKRKRTRIEAFFSNITELKSKIHFIYVNKRPVECPKLRKLVYDLFALKKHPLYLINVRISSKNVDLASNTVNFKNWSFIEHLIVKIVNKFLGKSENIVPTAPKLIPVLPDALNVIKGDPVKRKCGEPCEVIAKKPHISQENVGKQLIMEMFLKSTQVYDSQDDFRPNDTVIESNFLYERSFKSKRGNMSTAMSVSLKITSIRKTVDVKTTSKGLQTSFREPKPKYEEKSVQTDAIQPFPDDSFENFVPNHCSTLRNARESQLVFSLWPNADGKSLLERDLNAEKAVIASPFFGKSVNDENSNVIPEGGGIFKVKSRFEHLPKGFSPICATLESINASLSQSSKEKLYELLLGPVESELLTVKWNGDVKSCLENVYKSKAKQFVNEIPQIYDKQYKKFIKKLDNIKFSKESLQEVQILGQLDRKFIVAMIKSMSLLVIFDQHAVHERIRLEMLQNDYKNERVQLESPVLLFVSEEEWNLLNSNEYLEFLGFKCTFLTKCLFINEIPACLFNKIKRNVKVEDVCKMVLNEIVELLKKGNCGWRLPEIMQNIINLEACRGAIKFGDTLSVEECVKLVAELRECDLPFQCAHGRPTIQPLVRICMDIQQRENLKINLKNLKI